MNDLQLVQIGGQEVAVMDSRDIALATGKRHGDLLETIKSHIKKLLNGKFRSVDFFIESSYNDKTGRTLPCFLVTKKGCALLANKMTGEKGMEFSASYVSMFDKMETHIQNPKAASGTDLLQIQNKIIEQHQQMLQSLEVRLVEIEDNMLISPQHSDTIQSLYRQRIKELLGDEYKNASIRSKAYAEFRKALEQQFYVRNHRYLRNRDFENVIGFISSFTLSKHSTEKSVQ